MSLRMNKDNYYKFISPIIEIIEEARNGKMYILVDDPDRENEGDLILPFLASSIISLIEEINL